MKKNKNQSSNEIASLRDHMANERTFLAWIRTSIGIMAFGFVVEKFSLFLRQIQVILGKSSPLASYRSTSLHGYAPFFGVILISLGALVCLLAFINYRKTKKQINHGVYSPTLFLDVLLILIVFMMGLFLAIYLSHL